MIEIKEDMSDKQKRYLEYWINELKQFKNMAGNSINYKGLFKAITKLESEILIESYERDQT